jgi:hypothetical protein
MEVVLATADGHITVPGWIRDKESFRRWVESTEFPAGVSVWFADGDVHVELPSSGRYRREVTDPRTGRTHVL